MANRYGRERLALYLLSDGLDAPPHTIRHILRRNGRIEHTHQRRKPLYPALWAWDVEEPFCLIQTDLKDILDKQALGTTPWDHIRKHRLPRYQWTACNGRTRLRFLAYNHTRTSTNGPAFMVLVLLWLRAFGITTTVTFQTGWGEESGGDNPDHVAALEAKSPGPVQGQLKRYPMGRKGYSGRVERSHRAGDDELHRLYLLSRQDERDTLPLAAQLLYFYNVQRPHFGQEMNKEAPLRVL